MPSTSLRSERTANNTSQTKPRTRLRPVSPDLRSYLSQVLLRQRHNRRTSRKKKFVHSNGACTLRSCHSSVVVYLQPVTYPTTRSTFATAMTSKYRIEAQGPNGSHIVASTRIARGTLVLTETPLLQIPVGRQERFNGNEFWSAGNCSGAKQLTHEYEKAASNRRQNFDNLHLCRPKSTIQLTSEKGQGDALTEEEWERLNRAHTNAFERVHEDDEGTKSITFDIFNGISCINHFCTPNAVFHWDSDLDRGRGRGVIYALTRIDQDQEITISYLNDLEFALWSGQRRIAELNNNWNFICGCATCAVPNGQTSPADDQQRHALATLHAKLKFVNA